MCLCGNLGLLKESGQYSTLAPQILESLYFKEEYPVLLSFVQITL